MLDDHEPEEGEDSQSQDAAQERIRGLEEQVELFKTQLDLAREQNTALEEVYCRERAGWERMRRVIFMLGLVAADLVGMLIAGVLAAWSLPTWGRIPAGM